MHRILFVCICFLLLIPVRLVAQQPFFRYYNLNEGFPHAQVWYIYQDRTGLMWFATGGGAVSYDGFRYNYYSRETGNAGNARSIFQDAAGYLWIPSDDGLAVFDGMRFTDFSLHESDVKNAVWQMTQDRNGRYWFPTRHWGLYMADGNHYIHIDTIPNTTFYSAYMDSRGYVWIGGKDTIYCLPYDGKTYDEYFKMITSSPSVRFGNVNNFHEDWENNVVICGSLGLFIIPSDLRKTVSAFKDYQEIRQFHASDGMIHNNVVSAVVTPDSSYWIATDHGLSRLRNGKFRNFIIDDNFSSNSLQYIFQDYEGVLWIATNGGGVIKVPYSDIYNFTVKDGLSSNVVNAITRDISGRIYFATDNGVDCYDGTKLFSISEKWHIPGDAVWVVKTDRQNGLWIGTEDHIYELRNGRLRERRDLYVSTDAAILDIEIDSRDRLWFGSHYGLSMYDGKKFRSFTPASGAPSVRVWCIYEDRKQKIWAGTNDGLMEVIEDTAQNTFTFRLWTKKDGLPNNTVNVIRQDTAGRYWIGTDLGLSMFDGKRFINYKATDLGLGDNVIPVVEIDPLTSHLWVGSTGFGRYEIRDTSLILQEMLNKDRGLTANEATTNNGLLFDQDGSLWIANFGGVTWYQRNQPQKTRNRSSVYITKIITNQITYAPNLLLSDRNNAPIAFKGYSVTFQFVGLSFINEKTNQYQYFLNDFDDEWSDFSTRNEVRYTNLLPGDYSFKVRMKNASGSISENTAIVHFTVKTPLWLNPFFIAGFVLVVIYGGYRLYHYRVNKKLEIVQRVNQELEEKIKERTSEIFRQKEELEKILNQLKQTHTQLLQSEKMASLGQLVAGVAHEINNPTSILAGNVNYVDDYIKVIKGLIAEYERYVSHDPEILKKIADYKETHDYDFIISDMDVLIGSIKNAAERIRHIVLDLRNFSRLDEAELNEVNIHDCIDTTVKLFMNQYKHILTIQKDYRASNKIFCYVNQINQVLLNVLVNSAHAIEIKLNGQKELSKQSGLIKISTEDNAQGGINIKIRDNGCGIPEQNLNKIFDPFFTTKPIGQGTGLGLSITYGIVQKHNGEILVSSSINEWTEFVIKLPFRPN